MAASSGATDDRSGNVFPSSRQRTAQLVFHRIDPTKARRRRVRVFRKKWGNKKWHGKRRSKIDPVSVEPFSRRHEKYGIGCVGRHNPPRAGRGVVFFGARFQRRYCGRSHFATHRTRGNSELVKSGELWRTATSLIARYSGLLSSIFSKKKFVVLHL